MEHSQDKSNEAQVGQLRQSGVSRRVIAIITASKRSFDSHVAKANRMEDFDTFVWVSRPQDAKGRTFDDYGHVYPWVTDDDCEKEVVSNLRLSRGG